MFPSLTRSQPFVSTTFERILYNDESIKFLQYQWDESQRLDEKDLKRRGCLDHDCFKAGCVKWLESDEPILSDAEPDFISCPPAPRPSTCDEGNRSVWPTKEFPPDPSTPGLPYYPYEGDEYTQRDLDGTLKYDLCTERTPLLAPVPGVKPAQMLTEYAEQRLRRAGLRMLSDSRRTEDGNPVVEERVPRTRAQSTSFPAHVLDYRKNARPWVEPLSEDVRFAFLSPFGHFDPDAKDHAVFDATNDDPTRGLRLGHGIYAYRANLESLDDRPPGTGFNGYAEAAIRAALRNPPPARTLPPVPPNTPNTRSMTPVPEGETSATTETVSTINDESEIPEGLPLL